MITKVDKEMLGFSFGKTQIFSTISVTLNGNSLTDNELDRLIKIFNNNTKVATSIQEAFDTNQIDDFPRPN